MKTDSPFLPTILKAKKTILIGTIGTIPKTVGDPHGLK